MNATAKTGVQYLSVNTKKLTLNDVQIEKLLLVKPGELRDGIIPGLQCRDKRWHSTNEKRAMVMLLLPKQL